MFSFERIERRKQGGGVAEICRQRIICDHQHVNVLFNLPGLPLYNMDMGLEGHVNRTELGYPGFRNGDMVVLRKTDIKGGYDSEVSPGMSLSGRLKGPIQCGVPIYLDSGSNTSPVKRIYEKEDILVVETQTSVYEAKPVFSGLEMVSHVGTVVLPSDAQLRTLGEDVAPELNIPLSNGEQFKIKIDKQALNDVLIETRGAVVHRLGSRYIVLARVGNAHVPYYRSSKGTDGKRQGEWYPFFGHTGPWIIKGGSVDESGDMYYSDELSRVRELLNDRLVLPDPKYLNNNFEIKTTDGKVMYSLGEVLAMEDFSQTPLWTQSSLEPEVAERMFVQEVTGYAPTGLYGYHPHRQFPGGNQKVFEWIDSITQKVTVVSH